MRRALIIVLAAVPAFAFAQTTPGDGKMTFATATINIAQCTGTQSSDPPMGESLEIATSFNVRTGGTAFGPGGTFRLWAANREVQAEQWNGTGTTSCENPQTAGDGFVHNQVVDSATFFVNDDEAQTVSVPAEALATAAQIACSGTSTSTIHVCLDWTPSSGGSPAGWATGTIELDPRTPGAPSNPVAAPGDGSLRVTSCTPGSSNTGFVARATIGTDLATARYSARSGSCSDIRIPGLVNGTTYTVVVFGLNTADNPSPPSTSTTGTPAPTDDFWEHYDGQDSGGCTTGTGAAGILGALALLALTIVVRRRKS